MNRDKNLKNVYFYVNYTWPGVGVELMTFLVSLNGDSSFFTSGWICYAEKTHGSYILPYISTTKSPQQVIGSLVKDYMASKQGIPPHQIYHVTVMPCFDKKLEASRSDFYNDMYSTRDVDCVITSGKQTNRDLL